MKGFLSLEERSFSLIGDSVLDVTLGLECGYSQKHVLKKSNNQTAWRTRTDTEAAPFEMKVIQPPAFRRNGRELLLVVRSVDSSRGAQAPPSKVD